MKNELDLRYRRRITGPETFVLRIGRLIIQKVKVNIIMGIPMAMRLPELHHVKDLAPFSGRKCHHGHTCNL
jgi:hypothetical protein